MPKVRVVIRCRPCDDESAERRWRIDRSRVSLRPGTPTTNRGGDKSNASSSSGGGGTTPSTSSFSSAGYEKTFQFDRVYTGRELQEDFFREEVEPLLCSALACPPLCTASAQANPTASATTSSSRQLLPTEVGPTNAVIFAYGQTGSGKTHTMDGQRAAASAKALDSESPRKRAEPRSATTKRAPCAADEGDECSKGKNEGVDCVEDIDDDDDGGGDHHDASEEETSESGSDEVESVENVREDADNGDAAENGGDSTGTAAAGRSAAPQNGEGVGPRALRFVFEQWRVQQRLASLSVEAADHVAREASVFTPTPPQSPQVSSGRMSLSGTLTDSGLEATSSSSPRPLAAAGASQISHRVAPYEIVRVAVSFLEIYNEKLFDLLSSSERFTDHTGNAFRRSRQKPSAATIAAMHAGCLRLRRCVDPQGNESNGNTVARFEVENLTRVSCISLEEALEYYYYGVSKKVFRSHNLNSSSSRAHAIFTIHLTFRDNTAAAAATDLGGVVAGAGSISEAPLITADIAIVDLAGSERLNSILPRADVPLTSSAAVAQQHSSSQGGGNHAALISESIHINKSLLTLGKVIMALSDAAAAENISSSSPRGGGTPRSQPMSRTATPNRGRVPPITPFRDSKLTMVINHALGGNARTLMIACIHLDPNQASESLSTLFYAARTSKISNSLSSIEDPRVARIKQLLGELAQLKSELGAANDTIASLKRLLDVAAEQPCNGTLQLQSTSSSRGGLATTAATGATTTTPTVTPRDMPSSDLPQQEVHRNRAPGRPLVLGAADPRRKPPLPPAQGTSASLSSTTTPPLGPPVVLASANDAVGVFGKNFAPIEEQLDHAELATGPHAEVLSGLTERLHEACMKLKTVLEANARLRRAYDDVRSRAALLEREREQLDMENMRLKEKLDMYDALLLAQIAINREVDTNSRAARERRQQHRRLRQGAVEQRYLAGGGVPRSRRRVVAAGGGSGVVSTSARLPAPSASPATADPSIPHSARNYVVASPAVVQPLPPHPLGVASPRYILPNAPSAATGGIATRNGGADVRRGGAGLGPPTERSGAGHQQALGGKSTADAPMGSGRRPQSASTLPYEVRSAMSPMPSRANPAFTLSQAAAAGPFQPGLPLAAMLGGSAENGLGADSLRRGSQ